MEKYMPHEQLIKELKIMACSTCTHVVYVSTELITSTTHNHIQSLGFLACQLLTPWLFHLALQEDILPYYAAFQCLDKMFDESDLKVRK